MKLVEILARELEVWPEWAIHAMQSKETGRIFFYGECGSKFDFVSEVAEDLNFIRHVTPSQWQAERDRMKAMKSIELKDTEGLCEALKDWEAAGKPMGDWVTITEPAVSYEQELWDKVASSAIGGIVASSAFHNYQNFQGNVANAVDFASQVADAFMAERAKRVKGD